jgi:subtilisin family serine protease
MSSRRFPGERKVEMKRLLVLTIVVFFALTGLCLGENYVPGEILVKWKKGVSQLSVQNVQRSLDMKAQRTFTSLRIHHMKLRRGMKVKTALTQLRQNPNVEYAEPNYIMRALATTPNDPQFGQLWGLHNTGENGGTADADIDAPEAWDIHTGSTDVVIAVLDTGIDFDHYDIGNGSNSNIWTNTGEIPGNGIDDDGNGYIDDVHGWDFVGEDNDPTDYYHDYWGNAGHGTHVAGTIAALGNNSVGITGVNWYASIMPLRILGAQGATDTPRAIAAIMYAADNGAKVINASWGGGGPSQALEDAISYANDRGCLFVAAAGNGGDDTWGDDNDLSPFYPASYDLPNIIAVAATDHNDTLGDFSNYGATSVDVAAPGVQILSSVPVIEVNSTVNTALIEEFDSGLTGWVSWGTNNTWEVSNWYYYMTPPNSLADSPYDNYVDDTDSYIIYDTPFSLVDKYVWMEFDLRCDFGSLFDMFGDYLLVGGDLGDGNGFLPVYLLNLEGWFGGSTDGSFTYYTVDLSPLWDLSASIKVGFNLYSNSSITNDGVYIDNVWLNYQNLDITGHDYALFDGTSMAAPHVAGLAGLIIARYPTITLEKLKDRILHGVDVLPNLQGKVSTSGRINAYKAIDPAYSAELAVDFGNLGFWDYTGSSWSRLDSSNPEHLAAYSNKLVGDFGAAGLLEFDGTSWSQLTPWDADNSGNCMVAYGTGLVIDFGSLGLYQYDGGVWSRLTPSDAQYLATYGGKLVGDFGAAGLWEFDGSSWTKLTPSDADNSGNCMVAYGTGLVIDFGSLGLYRYDGGVWSKLTPSDAQYLATYGGKLVGDFGAAGLWEFDGSSWTKLTPSDADNRGNCMVAVDFT